MMTMNHCLIRRLARGGLRIITQMIRFPTVPVLRVLYGTTARRPIVPNVRQRNRGNTSILAGLHIPADPRPILLRGIIITTPTGHHPIPTDHRHALQMTRLLHSTAADAHRHLTPATAADVRIRSQPHRWSGPLSPRHSLLLKNLHRHTGCAGCDMGSGTGAATISRRICTLSMRHTIVRTLTSSGTIPMRARGIRTTTGLSSRWRSARSSRLLCHSADGRRRNLTIVSWCTNTLSDE